MNKKFTVVHFLADKSVEVVPSTWLSKDGKTCPFPISQPKGFKKLQEDENSVPDPLWPFWIIDNLKSYGNSYNKESADNYFYIK